ncbi:MAG: DNA-binding transcriptional LysR family regulator, partial [Myxococcota bacterium]
MLLPHAEVVEQQADSIARLAAGQRTQATGRVRLALPEGLAELAIVPRLIDLQRSQPGLAIDLVIGPALVDLVRREADIAMRFVRPVRGDLVAKKLADFEFGVFGRANLVAGDPPLATLPWILLQDPEARFPETRWHNTYASTSAWMYTSSYTTLLAALQAGLGVGIISRLGARELGLTELKTKLPPPPSFPLYLVTHRAV